MIKSASYITWSVLIKLAAVDAELRKKLEKVVQKAGWSRMPTDAELHEMFPPGWEAKGIGWPEILKSHPYAKEMNALRDSAKRPVAQYAATAAEDASYVHPGYKGNPFHYRPFNWEEAFKNVKSPDWESMFAHMRHDTAKYKRWGRYTAGAGALGAIGLGGYAAAKKYNTPETYAKAASAHKDEPEAIKRLRDRELGRANLQGSRIGAISGALLGTGIPMATLGAHPFSLLGYTGMLTGGVAGNILGGRLLEWAQREQINRKYDEAIRRAVREDKEGGALTRAIQRHYKEL